MTTIRYIPRVKFVFTTTRFDRLHNRKEIEGCGKNTHKTSPKRYRTFELPRQWAGAGRLRRWCCVAGTLSFILTLATSRHFRLVMSYAALSERVFSALGDFLQVEEWRILKSNVFAWNSVSNWKKPLRRLFRCCNRLMGRTVWAARNVTSGISVSNRAERPSKVIPNLDGFLRQRATITLRSAFCDTWKSSSNYPWSFRRSRHL